MEKQDNSIFDETGYESEGDEELDVRTLHRKARQSQKDPKALTPAESNMTLSMRQGEELIEMMKNRGFEMNEAEIKKMKTKQTDAIKTATIKAKAGFYDGGHAATIEELISALNKAYSQNDTQQASCILSFILEKKQISKDDHNKFALMKCNLLFNHGNYQQCCKKASQFLQFPHNQLSAAILSTYIARCKAQLGRVWQGYIDLQRAKSLLMDFKIQKQAQISSDRKNLDSEFLDSQLDSVIRDLNTAELEYNIRINKEKHIVNTLQPFFSQLRNRKIIQISCGDHHALFLVGGSYDEDIKRTDSRTKWATEVFGIGQNSAGQVLGKLYEKSPCTYNPILIKQLSGKGIKGIYASKQSSLAYDEAGNIYQWGVKSSGKKQIEKTLSISVSIQKLQKGSQHYAMLSKTGRFFVWGSLICKQKLIFNETKPIEPKTVSDVIEFSCGNSNIVVITRSKEVYAIGSNQFGQISHSSESLTEFAKLNIQKLGKIQKVYCLGDCTFLLTEEQQLYYSGRYSYKKDLVKSWKLAEFTEEITQIISVSGYTGMFYVTNQNGVVYRWDVDNSVKFKKHIENQKWTPRIVQCSRAMRFNLKTIPQPELCLAKVLTKTLKTYTPIIIEISLMDNLGTYGLQLSQSLKINLCLSKKMVNNQELISSSEKFIKLTGSKYITNQVYVDQIINNSLISYSTLPNNNNPSKILLEIMVEKADTYYLYLLINSIQVKGSPLEILVEQSEKQADLEKKMLEERERKKRLLQDQKKREEENKRLEEQEKLAELQKMKETQMRADAALKKYMKQQEEERLRIQEERKRKSELQTGGGFDLNKLKAKNSNSELKEQPYKSTIPQLPDINARPSSKRKLVLKKAETPTASNNPSTASTTLKTTALKRADSKSKKPS